MPTPTGMLKVGERIRHTSGLGIVYVVTRRHGSRVNDYSIQFRREDGKPIAGRTEGWLHNTDWMLRHRGWELAP